MKTKNLNELVARAKQGCCESRWMVKRSFQNLIHKQSDRVRNQISNVAAFEEACYSRIDQLIDYYDLDKGMSFRRMVITHIFRRARDYINQYSYSGYTLISINDTESRDGYNLKQRSYEIPDDLAIVDDDLITKEKIARLAANDPRKLAILTAWTYECINDTETAAMLAQRFGGNSESHRKYIQRFRTACQENLARIS